MTKLHLATTNLHKIYNCRYIHRVMAWCALTSFKIIGHFFKSKGGETVTVTAEHCCEMSGKVKPQIQEIGSIVKCCFSKMVLCFMCQVKFLLAGIFHNLEMWNGHLVHIMTFGLLTTFCGLPVNPVCVFKQQTTEHLKTCVCVEIARILAVLHSEIKFFTECLKKCRVSWGWHIIYIPYSMHNTQKVYRTYIRGGTQK